MRFFRVNDTCYIRIEAIDYVVFEEERGSEVARIFFAAQSGSKEGTAGKHASIMFKKAETVARLKEWVRSECGITS